MQIIQKFTFLRFSVEYQKHLKALNTTGRGEEIPCRVIKLKNLIVAKDRESRNMLSQENFEF